MERTSMTDKNKIVVVGLGEVGRPLFELMSQYHDTVGVDLAPTGHVPGVDVLHICFPFEIPDFIGETARYIELYRPSLTVVNSTVGIGTTRAIAKRTGTPVVNSPIRGKHARMLEELHLYTKFIGAMDAESGERAARHFQSVGMKIRILSSPEASELAKLTETTYFGLLIAWAQEVERYCDSTGADYNEVIAFYDEIKYLPSVQYFPGIIGGHCVMPNIKILTTMDHSDILAAIQSSNAQKVERERRNKEAPAIAETLDKVPV
jgi:UDP-N-acetyl-D-mannosaminuronate dehydrogenase